MKKEKNILKNYLLYFSTLLLTCIIGISNIFADTVALGTQYVSGQMCDSSNTCEWVENTNFYNGILISNSSNSRHPKTFGWNFNMNSSTNTTYTSKFTLAFYYDYNFNLSGYWYFKDYIQGANVQFGELNGNAKTISCSTSALERSTSPKSDKITVTCIFTPKESGSRYYFLGVTNTNYANYGYVPFGSGTSFTVESNTIEGSTDNSGVIINQNQTIINQNQQQIQQQQEIINNQNQNTQDIINNQDQNNEQQIESQKVCTTKVLKYSDTITNAYISSETGNITSNTTWGITDYIELNKLEILTSYNSRSYSCFYNDNKELISCISSNYSVGEYTLPSGTKYARFSIRENDVPEYKVSVCQNGNQAISEQNEEAEKTRKGILGKIKDLFDTLFSNDDADVSDLDNMVGWLPPGPVDSIINLPLAFFNALTNTLTGTCQSVSIPIPFVNQTLVLPCFDAYMSQYLTGFNTLWTLVGGILSIFILYYYLLSLYKWVDDTLTFRENNLPGYYDDNWGGGA